MVALPQWLVRLSCGAPAASLGLDTSDAAPDRGYFGHLCVRERWRNSAYQSSTLWTLLSTEIGPGFSRTPFNLIHFESGGMIYWRGWGNSPAVCTHDYAAANFAGSENIENQCRFDHLNWKIDGVTGWYAVNNHDRTHVLDVAGGGKDYPSSKVWDGTPVLAWKWNTGQNQGWYIDYQSPQQPPPGP